MLELLVALGLGAAAPRQSPRPPAAAPRSAQTAAPVDSAARERARQRDRALADSIRRAMEARSDSLVRARRLEAAKYPPPEPSPLFGEPPFYGYNWVFYADLIAGGLSGMLAVRWRRRTTEASASFSGRLTGILLGALAGAVVFLPFYLMNALLSIGFSPMPPRMLFGLTLAVIGLTVLSVAFHRRRPGL
jgi:hypothetical protein